MAGRQGILACSRTDGSETPSSGAALAMLSGVQAERKVRATRERQDDGLGASLGLVPVPVVPMPVSVVDEKLRRTQ